MTNSDKKSFYPSEIEIREFWERCGFIKKRGRWQYDACKETNYYWEAPDGRRYKEFPALDLNNLFKYAVPKVPALDFVELKSRERGWICKIRGFGLQEIASYYVDPALALFWVLWQVMKEEQCTST